MLLVGYFDASLSPLAWADAFSLLKACIVCLFPNFGFPSAVTCRHILWLPCPVILSSTQTFFHRLAHLCSSFVCTRGSSVWLWKRTQSHLLEHTTDLRISILRALDTGPKKWWHSIQWSASLTTFPVPSPSANWLGSLLIHWHNRAAFHRNH